MVTKITFPQKMEAALYYNENKVAQEKAVCLYAGNYLKDAAEMNFPEKLEGFKRLMVLNERATTKTIHISLNFDPSEKFTHTLLVELASLYMEKIGFGEQPFLVYQHTDAAHPHVHIVSTTIREDGSRIHTHNIGRNQSEKARMELEKSYGLVQAGKQRHLTGAVLQPLDLEKAVYGRHETKRAISNIVTTVFHQFRFTSLPQYNAVLGQFNVMADRGKEDGRVYRNRGLVYRMLDREGNKVGVPIKASAIPCSPTLNHLEEKFRYNKEMLEPLKDLLKKEIDACLAGAHTIKELTALLEQQKVYTVCRQNANNVLYGITFVDHKTKCVFNGSDLGKPYSVASLQSRLATQAIERRAAPGDGEPRKLAGPLATEKKLRPQVQKSISTPSPKTENPLDALAGTKESYDPVPFPLGPKRKRKKRKNHKS